MTDLTFVLSHNAGIVSEPGHPHRRFRIAEMQAADAHESAQEWAAASAMAREGDPALEDAPGGHVLQGERGQKYISDTCNY
jgi:hypothetical protein